MPASLARGTVLLLAAASVAGTIALFLHFTFGVSPLAGLQDRSDVWRLAAPFFVVPLLGGAALWLLTGRPLPAGVRVAAYVVAAIALSVTLATFVEGVWRDTPSSGRDWAIFAGAMSTLVIGVWMVVRTVRRDTSRDRPVLIALLFAYLPNAVLCLAGFAGEWQIGASISCGVAAAYAIAAGSLALR